MKLVDRIRDQSGCINITNELPFSLFLEILIWAHLMSSRYSEFKVINMTKVELFQKCGSYNSCLESSLTGICINAALLQVD